MKASHPQVKVLEVTAAGRVKVPFRLYPINRNSDLPSYSSRDLTLEAFEDGHAHVLHA